MEPFQLNPQSPYRESNPDHLPGKQRCCPLHHTDKYRTEEYLSSDHPFCCPATGQSCNKSGNSRDRTCGLPVNGRTLCHLSYEPKAYVYQILVFFAKNDPATHIAVLQTVFSGSFAVRITLMTIPSEIEPAPLERLSGAPFYTAGLNLFTAGGPEDAGPPAIPYLVFF